MSRLRAGLVTAALCCVLSSLALGLVYGTAGWTWEWGLVAAAFLLLAAEAVTSRGEAPRDES